PEERVGPTHLLEAHPPFQKRPDDLQGHEVTERVEPGLALPTLGALHRGSHQPHLVPVPKLVGRTSGQANGLRHREALDHGRTTLSLEPCRTPPMPLPRDAPAHPEQKPLEDQSSVFRSPKRPRIRRPARPKMSRNQTPPPLCTLWVIWSYPARPILRRFWNRHRVQVAMSRNPSNPSNRLRKETSVKTSETSNPRAAHFTLRAA